MKSLILGSAGQIGNALIKYLSSTDITTFDIADSLKQDLRKPKIIDDKINECDFVYFLAFDVGGSHYLKKYQNTYNFLDNNMKIMTNTFESIKKYNKPFIFASSQMSNMDYSSYGTLKRIGEYYTKILNGITVKFWNVYGVETDLNKSHVITDFILKAKTGCIDMLTTGKESRQFLYAEDCCEALVTLATKYKNLDKNQEYHITSFKWNKVIDVAKIVQSYIDCDIKVGKIFDTVQANTKNKPNKFILNFWKPKTTLQNGIKKIINDMI